MGDTGEKTHHIGIHIAQLVCRELRPVRVDEGVLVIEQLTASLQHITSAWISLKTGGQTWSVLINRLPCQALESSCCFSIHIRSLSVVLKEHSYTHRMNETAKL